MPEKLQVLLIFETLADIIFIMGSVHIEIVAEKVFSVFGFPVTNTLMMGWITVFTLSLLAYISYRKIGIVPGMVQNLFEVVVDKLLDAMSGVFETRIEAEKYFPVVATIFLFVLVSNWLGILPGVGSIGLIEKIGEHEKLVPFFRSTASDLNFTLALALISVFLTNIFGITALGIRKHTSKFINFKGPIDFFVGILELISEIAKMISFSFRLFGNVFAGEVLLVIIGFLVPFVIPMPFLLLEIFVGFIQALVFAMLTIVFISMAISHH